MKRLIIPYLSPPSPKAGHTVDIYLTDGNDTDPGIKIGTLTFDADNSSQLLEMVCLEPIQVYIGY